MIPRYALFVLAALLCRPAPAGAQRLDVTVRGMGAASAALSSLSGETAVRIDSVRAAGPGRFVYEMAGKGFQHGFYRLSFDAKRWIDFLFDGGDVTLETDASAFLDSMRVVASDGNRLFNAFVMRSKQYRTKSEILQFVLNRYPKDDPYYGETRRALSSLQSAYGAFADSASGADPRSFIGRYVATGRLPVVDPGLSPDRQLEYLKSHALDHVDFSDADLVRSDVFVAKTIEYLMYYRNPSLPKELLQKEFMKASDSILTRARVNELVYKHVTEYLLSGFREYGFDECIEYIIERYVVKDELCLDESAGSTIAEMVEQKKLFAPGNVLPAITLPDSAGNPVDLGRLGAERVLVVFYSTGCPHCRTLMPKLKEAYDRRARKETEVLSVSLDTDRNEWLGFIREKGLTWPSVSDFLGWAGPVVDAYHVYATPAMVLVDPEMRVIDAPSTIDEAKKWF
jgi:peroxiredoxin